MGSMTEKDILDSLEDLGYKGPVKDASSLKAALEKGISSKEFVELIAWISSELRVLCNFDEQIHPLNGPDDESSFMVELSSFIREMNCPYPTLTDGPISQRLSQVSSRVELVNYLLTELQAVRMTTALRKVPISDGTTSKAPMAESSTAAHLRDACLALGLPKPPVTVTSQQLFSKLSDKVKEQLSKLPKGRLGNPLFVGALNSAQWKTLDQLNDQMKLDYRARSELLIQRLDVTIQSFSWSDRVKKQEDQLLRVYRPLRQQLKTTSTVSVADLLAARDDLTLVEKTASSNLRTGTTTKLNKLLIKNAPPDRGGRPSEIEPPPPEMPPWQKRTPGGGGQYGGPQAQRQHAGGRGSGRVQGGGWQGGHRGGGRQDSYSGGRGGGQGGYHDKGYQDYQQPYGGGYNNQQFGQGADAGHYQQQSGGYHQQQNQSYRGGHKRGGGGRGQW